MATMRRDYSLLVLVGLTSLTPQLQAQKIQLKPGLDVSVTATTNASGFNAAPRKDLVFSAAPQLEFSTSGAHSRLEGKLKIEQVHFSRQSQPDRTLPSGDVLFRTQLLDNWGGIEAQLLSYQTPATLISSTSGTPGITESYTTTQTRLAPYLEHAFDTNTQLNAKVEYALIQSGEVTPGLASRPDLRVLKQAIRLERQPTPLGAWVDWVHQDTTASGQSGSILKQDAGRVGLSYAFNDQFRAGPTWGRESIQVLLAKQDDTISGMNVSWRPNDRADLQAKLEHRFFGPGWRADWSYRQPSFATTFFSEREASTYAASLGTLGAGDSLRGLLDRMLTTYTPDETTRAKLVDQTLAQRGLSDQLGSAQEIYSLSAVLQQTSQLRFALLGKRNTLTLSAGVYKTEPLPLGNAIDPTANADRTLERYIETQWSHRINPLCTVNAGVRWGLANITSTINPSGQTRTQRWSTSLTTKLSEHAFATAGLRYQKSDGSLFTFTNDETALFVGLGYRY